MLIWQNFVWIENSFGVECRFELLHDFDRLCGFAEVHEVALLEANAVLRADAALLSRSPLVDERFNLKQIMIIFYCF
jgi:hypothetical protein